MSKVLLSTILLSLFLQGCGGESKSNKSPSTVNPVLESIAESSLKSTIKQPTLADLTKLKSVAITEDNARFIAQLAIEAGQNNLPKFSQYQTLKNEKTSTLIREAEENNKASSCAEKITRIQLPLRPILKREREFININNCVGNEDNRLRKLVDLSTDEKNKISLHRIEKSRLSLWKSGPALVFSTASNNSEVRYNDLLISRHNLERRFRGNHIADSFIVATMKGSIYSALLGGKITFTPATKFLRSKYSRDGDSWKLNKSLIRIVGQDKKSLLIRLVDGNLSLATSVNGVVKHITKSTTLSDLKINAKAYRDTKLQELKDKNSMLNEDAIDALVAQPYFNSPL